MEKLRHKRENLSYNKGDIISNMMYLNEEGRGIRGNRLAKFRCHCGNEFVTILSQVKTKHTKSCGCSRIKIGAKLTDEQVREVRVLIWKQGKTLKEVAEMYNVSLNAIWFLKVGKTYKKVL